MWRVGHPPITAFSTMRFDAPEKRLNNIRADAISTQGRSTTISNWNTAMPEQDRIIRLKTVLHRSGLSRSTVYRKMNEGTFPPRIKVNINGIGWQESELNRWIANPPAYRPQGLEQ